MADANKDLEYLETEVDVYDYQGSTIRCPYCGGYMEWCGVCNRYTQVCCIPYGTCMCS